jgi:hypothetical protein
MFTHKMDSLMRVEIDALKSELSSHKLLIDEQARQIIALRQDYTEVEKKFDELLTENSGLRSITEKQPEESALISPGHKPWSQRKRERIQRSASPIFVEKVMKSAATTEPEQE